MGQATSLIKIKFHQQVELHFILVSVMLIERADAKPQLQSTHIFLTEGKCDLTIRLVSRLSPLPLRQAYVPFRCACFPTFEQVNLRGLDSCVLMRLLSGQLICWVGL